MYLATYSYLGPFRFFLPLLFLSIWALTPLMAAEVYDRYASSANAAQGLLRNTLGATFPFFGVIMYDKLQYAYSLAHCLSHA